MNTREMLNIMRNQRDGKKVYNPDNDYSFKQKKSINDEPSMREMIKRVGDKLNEEFEMDELDTKETKESEEQKIRDYFQQDQVMIQIEEFIAFKKGVFMSGTADNQVLFAFKVTPDEQTSSPEYEVLEGFNPDDPANNELINKLTKYYDSTFYPYWRDNLIQDEL
jgi:hypothetical protein